MRLLARLVAVAVAGAAGVAVGVIGAFVHRMSGSVLGFTVPFGLLPALAALAALLLLTGNVVLSRLALVAPGIGWAVGVFPMAMPRPEGDLVVAATLSGYVFLLGGAVLIGLCIALPYAPATRQPVDDGAVAYHGGLPGPVRRGAPT